MSLRMKQQLPVLAALALCLGAGGSAGTTQGWDGHADLVRSREFARGLSRVFQDVSALLEPSVVSIRSSRDISRELARLPFLEGNDLMEQFLAHGVPRSPFWQHGIGTGVIVRADGVILTASHVVDGADAVEVRTRDGVLHKAEIVGTDPQTDLALLRIDARDLVPASLGDSADIEVGQWVVAMGDPFGLSRTMTAGIVSAKGRANVGLADYEDFIQTDAAINPGNSGGPLADLDGRIVGINTAIASEDGGFMGVGFAIPIDMVRAVMAGLIDHGEVRRGWIGLSMQDLTAALAESFGFPGTSGALVADVDEGGPAEQAGLRPGDIVVAYDGQAIATTHDLRMRVAATDPGARVIVSICRNGRDEELEVTLGQLRPVPRRLPAAAAPAAGAKQKLGFTLEELTEDLASKTGYPGREGVVVTMVEPASLAALSGFLPGDVIVEIGDTPLETREELDDALDGADLTSGVRIRVWNGGSFRFIVLKSG